MDNKNETLRNFWKMNGLYVDQKHPIPSFIGAIIGASIGFIAKALFFMITVSLIAALSVGVFIKVVQWVIS